MAGESGRMFGVVSGTVYRTIGFYRDAAPDVLESYIYDNATSNLSLGSVRPTTWSVPANESMRGIAYDGDDLLHLVLTKNADGKNYLITYSITGDSFTEHSEYNIALMLDRNCSNIVPNEFEKAFDTIRDPETNLSRIWEIKARKGGLIQLQTIYREANIIAITDNFVMFGDEA